MFPPTWLTPFVLQPRVIQPVTLTLIVPLIKMESRLIPPVVAQFVTVSALTWPIVVRTVSRLTYTMDTRNFTGNLIPKRYYVVLVENCYLSVERRRTAKCPSVNITYNVVETVRVSMAVYVVFVMLTLNGMTNIMLSIIPNSEEKTRKHSGAWELFNVCRTPETTPQKIAVLPFRKTTNRQAHAWLQTLIGAPNTCRTGRITS